MIVTKTIIGFVTQRYDTEKKRFIDQEFHGSDDREWENEMGESIDPPEVNGDEPYLNMEMIQPLPKIEDFEPGDEVLVTPTDNDLIEHEFQGVVIGIKDGKYIQVKDQDNDVWDCDPEQVHSVK